MPVQYVDAYLMCMCSWLYGKERRNVQSPHPSQGWRLFWNLSLGSKAVNPIDYMRAVPGRDDGTSLIWAPTHVLGEVRGRGTVREGVDIR
jgi:hypothetical protein